MTNGVLKNNALKRESDGMASIDTRGYGLGLILFVLAMVIVYLIRLVFFTERQIVQGVEVSVMASGPIVQWLVAGSLPVCLALGRYLAIRNMAGAGKAAFYILIAVSCIFIIWLGVVSVAPYAGISLPFFVNILGGYLLMLVTLAIVKYYEKPLI